MGINKHFNTKLNFIKSDKFLNTDMNLNKLIYQFLMYISQPYPSDIIKVEEPNILPSKKSKKCNVWNIGFRCGNTIRSNKSKIIKTNTNYNKTHNSPKPHIRKAHWHTYKVGQGRKNYSKIDCSNVN